MKRKRESSIDDRVAACPYHCMKRRRESSIYDDRVAACPYHCICSPTADNLNESKDLVKSVGEAFGQLSLSKKSVGEEKCNWEETKCPICLEAPHNAVLLECSNSTKGCRPYMCKTSKLQSNCLDQFLKSGASKAKPMLLCPLCRGPVNEWNDVEPAQRELMNSMPRSCSIETCEFSGTYEELEKHASTEHPSVQSSVEDTVRQLRMLSLLHERDLQDIRAMDSDRDFAPIVEVSFVSSSSGVIGQVHNRRRLTVRRFTRRERDLQDTHTMDSDRDFAPIVEVSNYSFVSSSSGVIGQASNRRRLTSSHVCQLNITICTRCSLPMNRRSSPSFQGQEPNDNNISLCSACGGPVPSSPANAGGSEPSQSAVPPHNSRILNEIDVPEISMQDANGTPEDHVPETDSELTVETRGNLSIVNIKCPCGEDSQIIIHEGDCFFRL